MTNCFLSFGLARFVGVPLSWKKTQSPGIVKKSLETRTGRSISEPSFESTKAMLLGTLIGRKEHPPKDTVSSNKILFDFVGGKKKLSQFDSIEDTFHKYILVNKYVSL